MKTPIIVLPLDSHPRGNDVEKMPCYKIIRHSLDKRESRFNNLNGRNDDHDQLMWAFAHQPLFVPKNNDMITTADW